MDVDADLLDVADGDDEESRGERGREGGGKEWEGGSADRDL